MTRFVGRVAERSAAVLLGVAALTVAAAVPAHAAYSPVEGGAEKGSAGERVPTSRSTGARQHPSARRW